MLKPVVKFYDFAMEECGFDLGNANSQVCQVEGKQLQQELHTLKQFNTNKETNAIVYNGKDVELIVNAVNHAPRKVFERDYKIKKGNEEIPMHSHTTIFNGDWVIVNVDEELTLKLHKKWTRVKITNKQTNKFTVSGETHYKIYVNDVLYKIDAPTVPDSTMKEKGYTVNYHGEQQFVSMLEKIINFK